ncbi:mitochondrial import receptor subunit TOM20-like protein [Tanacetum coccineum]
MDMMNVPELERIMLFEQARMAAEGEYLKNPTDVDNFYVWLTMIKRNAEAVSRLDEALSINPAKHEARWCLGNANTANSFLTSNHDEAKILFDEAFRCFERAVEEV